MLKKVLDNFAKENIKLTFYGKWRTSVLSLCPLQITFGVYNCSAKAIAAGLSEYETRAVIMWADTGKWKA